VILIIDDVDDDDDDQYIQVKLVSTSTALTSCLNRLISMYSLLSEAFLKMSSPHFSTMDDGNDPIMMMMMMMMR
jgi:hypothetical protein